MWRFVYSESGLPFKEFRNRIPFCLQNLQGAAGDLFWLKGKLIHEEELSCFHSLLRASCK